MSNPGNNYYNGYPQNGSGTGSSGGQPNEPYVVYTPDLTNLPNSLALTAGNNIQIVQNSGAGTITIVGNSTGSGAPSGSTYVTVNTEPSLANSRKAVNGNGITISDGGAQGSLTIGIASTVLGANYVTIGSSDTILTGKRALLAGPGLSYTDTGTNGSITLGATGYANVVGGTNINVGVSGTPGLPGTTFTVNATGYPSVVAGNNVTVTQAGSVYTVNATASSNSNGSVTSVSAGNATGLFSSSVATATTTPAISFTLSNSSGAGQVFAGPAGAGGAPSYRNLVNSDLPIVAGNNINLSTSGNNLVIAASAYPTVAGGTGTSVGYSGNTFTVSATGIPNTQSAFVEFGAVDATTPNARKIVAGTNIVLGDGGPGGNLTISAAGSSNSNGSVTNTTVGNLSPLFTTSTATPTTTPSTTFTLSNGAGFFAGPVGGSSGTPAYRAMVNSDLPILAGAGVNLSTSGNSLVIAATAAGGGVSTFSSGNVGSLFTTSVATPTSTPALSFTAVALASGNVYIGPVSGVAATPTVRALQGQDIFNSLTAGSNVTLSLTGNTITVSSTASGGGGGSVTSFSAGNASPFFSTSVSNSTTTPALSFSVTNANANQVLAGPTSGAASTPAYRALVPNDLPIAGGAGINLTGTGSTLTISATGVSSVTAGDTSLTISPNTGAVIASVTTNGITNAKFRQSAGLSVVGNSTNSTANVADITGTAGGQVLATNAGGTAISFRGLASTDLPITAGSGVNLSVSGNNLVVSASSATNGTVTTFTAGNLSPVFTSSVATATTTPALTFSLSNANANAFLGGPTSGAAAAPTYRALGNTDLPILAGTGVSFGTSGSSLVVSATGVSSIVAGTNITVTPVGSVYTISAAGSSNTNGTVTTVSAGNLSPLFTTSTSNQTTTPAVSFTLSNTGAASQFFAGPTSGGGVPSYRILSNLDLPVIAGSGINLSAAAGVLTISASSATSGTVTNFTSGNLSPLFTTSVATSSSTPAQTFSLSNTGSANQIFAGPSTGGGAPSYRSLVNSDLPITAGTGINLSASGNNLVIAASSATNGTVTSVSDSGLAGLFTASVGTPTTTPAISYALVTQASASVFAGPTSGVNATPTFRSLTGNDLSPALVAGTNITLVNNASNIVINAAAAPVSSVSNSDGTLTISPTTGAVVASLANNAAIPGSPTTTTQSAADNSTKVATTAFVNSLVSLASANNITSAGNLSPLFTTSTAAHNLSFTLTATASGNALLGPVSGANAAPTYRAIQGQDINAAISAGSGVITSLTGNTLTITATGFASATATPLIATTTLAPSSPYLIEYNAGATAFNIVLPSASGTPKEFIFSNQGNTVNAVTLQAPTGSLIAGASSLLLPANITVAGTLLSAYNSSTRIISDGLGNWVGSDTTSGGNATSATLPMVQAGGRLTTVSNSPLSDSASGGSATIYYCPYLHNNINIAGSYGNQTFSQVSLAVPASSGTAFTIYATANGNTALTLGQQSWTNTTTPPTTFFLNGQYYLDSGFTKIILGGYYCGTNSLVYDWTGARHLSNVTNRIQKAVLAKDATTSWTTTSTTPVAANGSTVNGVGQLQVFTCIQAEPVSVRNFSQVTVNIASGIGYITIALDGSTIAAAFAEAGSTINTGGTASCAFSQSQLGLHTYSRLNYTSGGSTATFIGSVNGFMEGTCSN